MVETVHRTPEASLRELFLRAAASLAERDQPGEGVGVGLGYLQAGFGAH